MKVENDSTAHMLENRKGIFLFGVPRGGTNIFCALAHNHDNIVALAQSGTKKFLLALGEAGEGAAKGAFCPSMEDTIYRKGGPRKDYDNVTHIMYDKVHWDRRLGHQYINTAVELVDGEKYYGVVLIRHPLAVLASMHNFYKKYGRERWRLCVENVAEYVEYYFLTQIKLLKEPQYYGVTFESFLKNLPGEYRRVCDYLGLDFKDYYPSFKATFAERGTPSGGVFETRMSDEYSGSYIETKGIKVEPQPMFYDPEAKAVTLGRGGFNPYYDINVERILKFRSSLDADQLKIIRKVFTRAMRAEDVEYILENTYLDIERLARMDVKSIAGYAKIASIAPRVKRWVARKFSKR